MKDKDRILKGIAAYKPMQEEIKQAIRDHGGRLTEDEFDAEFSTFRRFKDKDGVTRCEVRPLRQQTIGGIGNIKPTRNGVSVMKKIISLAMELGELKSKEKIWSEFSAYNWGEKRFINWFTRCMFLWSELDKEVCGTCYWDGYDKCDNCLDYSKCF